MADLLLHSNGSVSRPVGRFSIEELADEIEAREGVRPEVVAEEDLATHPTFVAKEQADVAAAATEADNREKARLDDRTIIKALALVVLDEINILRTQAGLQPRTEAQILPAIKGKLDQI